MSIESMERQNIILLVMDTARAKTVLPAIRNGTLPSLAEFTEDAMTFENTTTVAPWTLPSHASLFTGQYTRSHRTDADSPFFNSDIPPLAKQLSNVGYHTGGISANPWVSPEFGFDNGFDDFSMKWDSDWNSFDVTAAVNSESTIRGLVTAFRRTSLRKFPALMKNLWHKKNNSPSSDDGAKRVTSRAIDWMSNRSHRDNQFFLFLNYLEPHLPYIPPREVTEDFLSTKEIEQIDEIDQDPWRYIARDISHNENEFRVLKKLYLAELKYLDSQIGRLFSQLKRLGIYEQTAIFIIGDHGENIGEHRLMDHQYCLYETLVNVPLIAKHPQLESGVTDNRLVESRDLFPTILELAGVECDDLPTSVSQETLTHSSREHAISEYLTPQPAVSTLAERTNTDESFSQFDRALRSIRSKNWKFIESSAGTHELYKISDDPDEEKDIYKAEMDIAENMSKRLFEITGELVLSKSSHREIDEQSKQRLEELGYLQ